MDPFRSAAPPFPAEAPRRSLRRRFVVTLLVLLLLAGLLWGGLAAYRFAAPYLG